MTEPPNAWNAEPQFCIGGPAHGERHRHGNYKASTITVDHEVYVRLELCVVTGRYGLPICFWRHPSMPEYQAKRIGWQMIVDVYTSSSYDPTVPVLQ